MINSLSLVNFRNYDKCQVFFSPGMNCIVGRNGHGKTNLLEAVYYLSLLRSFRTSDVNELRQLDKHFFHLQGSVSSCFNNAFPDTELSVSYGSERKMMVDACVVYRASDFINKFVCVTFIPQDLSLVQGTPGQRRRFLDISASQFSSSYLRHLQSFMEALRSRNAMLKNQQKYSRNIITAYDKVFAREAAAIEIERRNFAVALNKQLALLSEKLMDNGKNISIKYMSRFGMLLQENNDSQEAIEETFLQQLDKLYERDCKNGSSTIGPHRSDFTCLMDNLNMGNYASQGECRMASLAIRLALLEILKEKLGTAAITLLIDDVIGELDEQRRENFFQAIDGIGQTLFACTELPAQLRVFDNLLNISLGCVVNGDM